MADSEVLKKLKDVTVKIQTASVKGRLEVIDEIHEIISSTEATDPIIRFVARVIGSTLHRYRDTTSQSFVKHLVASLAESHKAAALKHLSAVLLEIAEQLKNLSSTKNTCQTGLIALRWSSILVKEALKPPVELENVDCNTLVLAQATLLGAVAAFGNQKRIDKAYNMLHESWSVCGKDQTKKWLEVLLAQPSDSGPQLPIAFSVLCRHYKDIGDEATVTEHKTKILESFTKSLISVKTRPNSNYIKGSADLLRLLGKSDIQDSLLPSLHKAMLRSPETIIEAVGEVVNTLNQDLDGMAVDIGKSLIGNLHSKDEWVRSAAVRAIEQLSHRISDLVVARALLTHVFAVYNGAGGKLTSSEDKIAVLTGASTLRSLSVTQEDRVKLFKELCTHVSKVLDSETHERTLCAATETLAVWLDGLAALPDEVVAIFKKNLSAKSTTQVVRVSYFCMISRALDNCSAAQCEQLTTLVSAAVEKAVQQPNQPLAVCESICGISCLVRMDKQRTLSNRTALWASFTHPQKHVLLQDKVLTAASEDVLVQVVHLCRNVLENYPNIASDKQSPLYRALVMTLLTPMKIVRDAAIENVKLLLGNKDRIAMARCLLVKLNEVLEEGKIFQAKEKTPDDKSQEVTGKMVLDCVHALCAYTEYAEEDAQLLALDTLKACHHSLSVAENKHAWRKLVHHLKLEPKKLVSLYANNLKNTYICDYIPDETTANIVATLIATNPSATTESAIQCALDILLDENLLKVTRDEYFTYLTPEGELYDKSSVPGNDDSKEMNLKRESKAYSYKEQLEELQLKRELEEKRRKEGKVKEAPLSAKQKEAIKTQITKENAIRERLTVLNRRVECALGLLRATKRGSPRSIAVASRRVIPALLSSSRSPLAAEKAVAFYRELAGLLLPTHGLLAHVVAVNTLRLHKPQCDLDPTWLEEPLNKATALVINLIHEVTSAVKVETTTDDLGKRDLTKGSYFTAPGFCYVFPLLKEGLTSFFAKENESLLMNGLSVILHHAERPRPADAGDLERPEMLPLDHMFQLLIDLISSTMGRVQNTCTAALLATAGCASHGSALSFVEMQCLLSGLQSPLEVVRDAALRALLRLQTALKDLLETSDHSLEIAKRLFIAKFDVVEDNKELGTQLWQSLPSACRWLESEGLMSGTLQDVAHPATPIQQAAADALADLAAQHPGCAHDLLPTLIHVYEEALPLIPAKLDQFGHVIEEAVDEWGPRRGVAYAIKALAPLLQPETVAQATAFFVKHGLADRAEPVRVEMLNAAMTIVDLHGKETISSQLPVFEEFLDKAPKSGGFDAVRGCVVLLMGGLARHLSPEDARLRPIALRLVAALSTPSQQVQEAVSNCLPHLVTSPALKEDIPTIVTKLMKQLLTAEKYGDRKGAAYGIAGIVKGLGILALKQLDIMTKLTDAIQEKKNYKYREGALFAFEMLCLKLGRLFEPYIVHVLPHLLMCFGDSSQYVRAAADDTAKLIMSKLSAHGVKLVLPSLLAALHDDNWRTKAGSVELLGAMAYCAPKQLSSCLPSIVPKLIEVLSDSHLRVQTAGAEALKVIGSVIRNPEIQAIVPVLLHALQDPSNKTSACLQTLLDTKFVHFIDAPSLALIMPVVQRAFLDRSTETRKMAAQIIGNMYSLTDQKDLMPYLPNIIPGLKQSLLDPVPEVRSVSARALGAMVRGMGEASFEQLLPWLMATLTSEVSSVDRSGAAQGLAEVVAGLGTDKLHKLMPDIIATAERTDIAPHVKDGYIMMFIYMPGAFTDEFLPYIGQIINPILKALADENEYVRETALKAGQRIVNLYAESAITLLLPELEKGLFDENWRIRFSSVQLLGDLLYRISGVSGKMSTETASEDDNFGTEHSHRAIMDALGAERRNRVLAGLYMGRSDVALMVRQAALHVWKVVVTNTPKTLREILPTLFGLLLGCLASTSYDKRQVAARTLGDLVRKLGERVLPEIVPILERGLRSEQADQRQGVCIGLGEIIASTSRESILAFADGLVPTVRTALSDPLPEVRTAAARTFDSLHATIGSKALDDILPRMLDGLNDPDPDKAEATLDGLKQIMMIKSRAVLPYLIPQLTSGAVETRALSALAGAAGDALGRHLHRLLPALLSALAAVAHDAKEQSELVHCRQALLPVVDDAGIRTIIDTLLESSRTLEPEKKRAAAALLCAFVSHTRADLTHYVPQLLRGFLVMFAWEDRDIVQMSWEALGVLTKSLDAERLIAHVSDVRQAVRYAASDLKAGELLPGFCLPKGIAPILPLFRESILNGLPEDKEAAALMLGEVIRLTSAQALQPSVVHITGPLIRILGDRFTASVKAAVLETLGLLLEKVGNNLKQFLPQLQTTFLKSLNDPNRPVRIKAGAALSHLVAIHARADPLFLELHNSIKNTEDPGIRETTLQALRNLCAVSKDKLAEPLAVSVLATLTHPALLGQQDEVQRSAVGGCLGALLACLPPQHRDAAISHHVLASHIPHETDLALQHGRSCALFVALKETPELIYKDGFDDKVEKALLGYLSSEKIQTVGNGLRGITYLMKYLLPNERPVPAALLSQFVRSMNHASNEVKQVMCRASCVLGQSVECSPAVLKALLPALVNGTKEKNSYVRADAELALRAILRLQQDAAYHQKCLALLEEGAREALADAVARVGRRHDGPEPKTEQLDCTILT